MSAPDTNTRKQARRHRGPLNGMFAAVLFALVLLAGLVFWISSRGNNPEAGAQIDGRTGESSVEDTTGVSNAAAPLVQPEQTTGADASAGEAADTDPSDSQVSTPIGEEPMPSASADD